MLWWDAQPHSLDQTPAGCEGSDTPGALSGVAGRSGFSPVITRVSADSTAAIGLAATVQHKPAEFAILPVEAEERGGAGSEQTGLPGGMGFLKKHPNGVREDERT